MAAACGTGNCLLLSGSRWLKIGALQDEHSRGKVVRVRPSRLSLTANGTLNVCSSSRRQAEVEDRLYESPEELLNQRLEAASDVYSLVSHCEEPPADQGAIRGHYFMELAGSNSL